jgi:hypothetical protein
MDDTDTPQDNKTTPLAELAAEPPEESVRAQAEVVDDLPDTGAPEATDAGTGGTVPPDQAQ